MPTERKSAQRAQEPIRTSHPLTGKFIVFDGVDGCGKSTQLDEFEKYLSAAGVAYRRYREPGGTIIGEDIRNILLTQRGEGMHIRTEMLLYMASRAQLVYQEIRPALAAGIAVLTDRYTSSTLAYQGAAGGVPISDILATATAATENLWPDLTIILDVTIAEARQRTSKKGRFQQIGLFEDRIEQRATQFHERVREGFLAQCTQFPDTYRRVGATGRKEVVSQRIMRVLKTYFNIKK